MEKKDSSGREKKGGHAEGCAELWEGRCWCVHCPVKQESSEGVLGQVGWGVWSLLMGLREDVAGAKGPLRSLVGEGSC